MKPVGTLPSQLLLDYLRVRRDQHLDHRTVLIDSFTAGGISGAIAALVTTPFDVGKTRQQVARHAQGSNLNTLHGSIPAVRPRRQVNAEVSVAYLQDRRHRRPLQGMGCKVFESSACMCHYDIELRDREENGGCHEREEGQHSLMGFGYLAWFTHLDTF